MPYTNPNPYPNKLETITDPNPNNDFFLIELKNIPEASVCMASGHHRLKIHNLC